MDLDPCLNKSGFTGWQRTSQESSVGDAKGRFMIGVFGMHMGHVMLSIVKEVHSDHDSVEHRDCGHGTYSNENLLKD